MKVLLLTITCFGYALCADVMFAGLFPFSNKDKRNELNQQKKDTEPLTDSDSDAQDSLYSIIERALNHMDDEPADAPIIDQTQDIEERGSKTKLKKYEGCVRGVKMSYKREKRRCQRLYGKSNNPLETNETNRDTEDEEFIAEDEGVQMFSKVFRSLDSEDENAEFDGLSSRDLAERRTGNPKKRRKCMDKASYAYLQGRRDCGKKYGKW